MGVGLDCIEKSPIFDLWGAVQVDYRSKGICETSICQNREIAFQLKPTRFCKKLDTSWVCNIKIF